MKKGNIQLTRSFSYKLGQPNYSSVDFFCSITDECERKMVGEVSEGLHARCKEEVQKAIVEFVAGVKAKEKAQMEAEKEKVAEKSEKKAVKAEKHEAAKTTAELEAGDVEIIQVEE
jgi:hypothetical protein